MENEPLVSVIVNCYNCKKYLKETIDSVIAQTYKNWEIIFWDNVSTDDSSEIVLSYKDIRIKYFRGEKHVTLGEARNLAIEKANGEFIAFLDADDLWLSYKLEKQINILSKNCVDLVYSNFIFFSKSKERLAFKKILPSGYIFRYILGKCSILLSSAIITKKVFIEMEEWFDQELTVVEEHEFFARLTYKYKVIAIQEPLVRYRMHSSSFTWTKKELFFSEHIYMIKKLSKKFPDLYINYKKSIKQLNKRIAYELAIASWMKNKNKDVYIKLKKYVFSSPKFIIPILFSLFDIKYYWKFLKLLGRFPE